MYPSFQKDNFDISSGRNSNKDEELIDLKNYIKNLEQQINNFQSENEKLTNLNNYLQKEKIELNASLESKDMTINQQISLLDNLKKKNENNEIRIMELEKINQELNYLYIDLTEKNKSLIENQKLDLSINNNNSTEKLIQFSSKLENLSIMKSRLEHDNKILANKINQIQLTHENEINMLKKMHNSEIEKKNKIISNLQEGLSSINQNNINSNQNNLSNPYSQLMIDEISTLEKKAKKISEDNNSLKSFIQDLQSKIKYYEESIKRKENYIKELQKDLRNSEEQLKLITFENETFNQEKQIELDKINNEKEDLLKQNQSFKKAYQNFNINIQDANNLFIEKMKNIEDLLIKYSLKLKEYKLQLDELNEKNQILNYENEKLNKKISRIEKRDLLNKKINLPRNRSLNINDSRNNTFNSSPNSNYNFENKNIDNNLDINNYNYTDYNTFNKSLNNNKQFTNIKTQNLSKYILNDPYIICQQQSLEIFRNVLQKVDENLSNNINFLKPTKE